MWICNREGERVAWIYWDEQCEYCKNDCGDLYKNKMHLYLAKLKEFQNEYGKGIYGTLNFKCDYFSLDYEKYNTSPEGQQVSEN